MIEINLLPKNYLKGSKISLGKTGIYVIAAAFGVVVMLVSITFYQVYQLSSLEQNIEKAQQRAAILQQDIRVVDGLIDVKGKITQRMQAVENLDRNRTVWVRILEDLARNIPEFVWLSNFKEQGSEEKAAPDPKAQNKNQPETAPATSTQLPSMRKVELEGYAFTLNALAAFMIKMMRSDYFDEVELLSTNETKFGEKEKAYNFVMSCNLHYLSDEELQQIAQTEEKTTPSNSKTSHKTLN
jgi:type IV pilus assembly protein PilN